MKKREQKVTFCSRYRFWGCSEDQPYCIALKMVFRELRVAETPAVELLSWVTVPWAAASAAWVRAEVSTLERLLRALMTFWTLLSLINLEEPSIRPLVKSLVKAHKANVEDDFMAIKAAYQEKKNSESLKAWVLEKQKNIYVKIDPKWRNCEFQYPGWIK